MDDARAPLIAVGALTVLAGAFAFVLHYMLGVDVVAYYALVTALVPTLLLNLALAVPVYALVRAIVREPETIERTPEVELVV